MRLVIFFAALAAMLMCSRGAGAAGVESLGASAFAYSDTDVFIIVEEMPLFPGGESAMKEWVASNLKYPAEAAKKKIEGRVWVAFVVGKTGKVENVRVARPVNKLLDAEAVRLVKSMPTWTPGKYKGREVRVSYTIPVVFKL